MTVWTRHLGVFEENIRRSFAFLVNERAYAQPVVEFARDFFVVYARQGSSVGIRITIGWERDWFIPLILLEHHGRRGKVTTFLFQDLLRSLGIEVDTSGFPVCAEIGRKQIPGTRELWIHRRRRRQLLKEYVVFLEEYSNALRDHYELVVDELVGAPKRSGGG